MLNIQTVFSEGLSAFLNEFITKLVLHWFRRYFLLHRIQSIKGEARGDGGGVEHLPCSYT